MLPIRLAGIMWMIGEEIVHFLGKFHVLSPMVIFIFLRDSAALRDKKLNLLKLCREKRNAHHETYLVVRIPFFVINLKTAGATF